MLLETLLVVSESGIALGQKFVKTGTDEAMQEVPLLRLLPTIMLLITAAAANSKLVTLYWRFFLFYASFPGLSLK